MNQPDAPAANRPQGIVVEKNGQNAQSANRPRGIVVEKNSPDAQAANPVLSVVGEAHDPDATLDARGLRCPMPLLKAKQALNALSRGQVLQILTSDPASVPDFAAYARQVGHQILESVTQTGGEFRIVVRKA